MVRPLIKWAAAFWIAGVAAAQAQTPTIHDLMTLRDIGGYRAGIAISPDETHVAFFEREVSLEDNDYLYRLMVTPTAGGRTRILANAGGVIITAPNGRPSGAPADRVPQWSPDSRALAYVARFDGRAELWRVALTGGRPTRVAQLPGEVLRFAWLDRNRIVVETATPRATLDALAARRRRSGFHPDEAFEPYHSLVPFPALAVEMGRYVVEVQRGAFRPATSDEIRTLNPLHGATAGATFFNRSGSHRAWIAPLTADDDAATPRLGLFIDADAGARRCVAAECSGRMTGAWSLGDEVLFVRHDGPSEADMSLYAWNPLSDLVRRLRSGDEALLGCGPAASSLICLYETPSEPRRLVTVSSDGTLRTLYEPNPQWPAPALTRVERIYATDTYGNEGYAHLVYPADYRAGERYPLVIVQYRSRGFLRGGVGGEYPIHPLAAAGYFVLSVDRVEWRTLGAELSNRELDVRTELDASELTMKLSQIEAHLDQVTGRGLIDPARIAITGMSDGAETVYWAITETDRFAAALVSSPPTDPSAWALGSEINRRRLRALGTTAPWDDSSEAWIAWWRRNATIFRAEEVRAPLLMQLSDGEALMGIPLAVRLSELNRATDLYLYPDEHHVKWRPMHLLAAQERSLAWLDFWLRDIERADPDEPERLSRWRALRDHHVAD